MRVLFAAALVVAGSPAFAQDKDNPRAPRPPPPQFEDFTDVYVEGQIVRPSVMIAGDRAPGHFLSLIDLRADFAREMRESVDQIR